MTTLDELDRLLRQPRPQEPVMLDPEINQLRALNDDMRAALDRSPELGGRDPLAGVNPQSNALTDLLPHRGALPPLPPSTYDSLGLVQPPRELPVGEQRAALDSIRPSMTQRMAEELFGPDVTLNYWDKYLLRENMSPYVSKMAGQRQAAAQQLAQLQQQQQQQQWGQAWSILSSSKPWSEQKKMLGSLSSNPYAKVFAQVGDERLFSELETLKDFLDPNDLRAFQQNPDQWVQQSGGISGIEAKVNLARDRMKVSLESREQLRYRDQLEQKLQRDPQSLSNGELSKLQEFRQEDEKRQLLLSQLQSNTKKAALEATAASAPKPTGSFKSGELAKEYVIDPKTGVTTLYQGTQQPSIQIDLGSKEAYKDYIKSTKDTYDKLKEVPVALSNIDKAIKLAGGQARAFMGPGGPALRKTAEFLNNRLGLRINPRGIQDAKALETLIFTNILDNLKKLDAQPSERQQEVMQAALGQIGEDPQALQRMLKVYGESLVKRVELYNLEVEGAMKKVDFPFNPRVTLPDHWIPIGELSEQEWKLATEMNAQGKTRAETEAAIRQLRKRTP